MTRRPRRPATHGRRSGRLARAARTTACLLTLLGLGPIPLANAQKYVEPELVERVTVGAARGAAPLAGVTGGRSRQAAFALPAALEIAWRARVTAPVGFEPVVDERARIVLAHERGTLSQLDGSGKVQWSLRLGDASPSTGPVLMSDGARAILSHDNVLFRISGTGMVLSQTPTALSGNVGPPLPLGDGGLALAAGTTLVRLDHTGEPIARAETGAEVLSVLEARGSVFAVCKDGRVYQFRATGVLVERGNFGHSLRTVALSGSTLYAISAEEQLWSLDLGTKATQSLYSATPNQPLAATLALGPGAVYTSSNDGVIRAVSAGGAELWRAVVTSQGASGPGLGAVSGSRLLILAGQGTRIAVAQPGSELVVLDEHGSYQRVKGGACLSPTALTPLGHDRLLLTCRSGELLALKKAA